MTKLLLLLSIFTLSSTLFGQQSQTWNSLEKNEYSINYPKDWDLDQSGIMGTSFIMLSQPASTEDQFKENVNLLIQDLTGYNLDLKQYIEISLDQIATLITNARILENKELTKGNTPYQKIVYTGQQGAFDLKFEAYCWVIKNKAYVLTFTAEQSEFENYQATGESILNSFKIN